MDTLFLESFIAVAELGSMAAAARALGVTPAAVAQRIRALEGDIGAPLVTRAGRTVAPTEAGIAVLARGRVLLRDVRELRSLAFGDAVVGQLRLGAVSTAITGILPAIFRRLLSDAPQIELYVVPGTSEDLYRRVIEGDLDGAVLVEPPFSLPKVCEWRELRAEPLIVLAQAEFCGRDAHDVLREEPFIRYDRTHWGGRLADLYLQKAGILPSERLELDTLEAIAVMVDAGIGVSLVPDWAPPWPEGLSLAKLTLPEPVPLRRMGMLWLRGSPHLRLIRALLSAAASETQPRLVETGR